MEDNHDVPDQTEAVCAPIIRLSATAQASDGSPLNGNGVPAANFDQTEPCGFAPLMRLSAEGGGTSEAT